MLPNLVTKNIFENIPNMAAFYLNTFVYEPVLHILSVQNSVKKVVSPPALNFKS